MIHKVEVGHPVTMTVSQAEEVEGQFGPQIKFTADNDDILFAGKDTALRQLGRIGYDLVKVAGQTLLFEKVAKNGKTYLNINPAGPKASGAKAANGAQAQRGNGGIPAGAGSASVRPPRPLVPLYEDCFSAAKGIVQKQLGAKATTADVVAACATLFIQATKNQSPLFATAQDDWDTPVEELTDDLPF